MKYGRKEEEIKKTYYTARGEVWGAHDRGTRKDRKKGKASVIKDGEREERL